MKTQLPYTILKIVLALVVIAFIGFFASRPKVQAPIVVNSSPTISGDVADFVSFSIAPGAKVSGIIAVTGMIKGAYFFEANARGMLLDSNKNILKNFQLTASGDWMTSDPVSFTATIDATGIASGSGYIRLENDNPSGDPTKDKYIDIPVVF